jgi:hypothetical protein
LTSNKNSRIAWAELKKLNNDSNIIDKLETIHGRVSGGAMHNGVQKTVLLLGETIKPQQIKTRPLHK